MLAVLLAPPLNGTRSAVAASLLSRLTGREVAVGGEVSVELGAVSKVMIHGVSQSGASLDDGPIGRVSLDFRTAALLSGRFDLQRLELAGLRFVLDGPAAPHERPLPQRIAAQIGDALGSPLLGKLTLNDVQVMRTDDPDGWNWTLSLHELATREAQEGVYAIEGKAAFDGQPVELAATLPDLSMALERDGPQNLDVSVTAPGLAAELRGRLHGTSRSPALDAQLAYSSTSLGDLQESFGLKRLIEGSATGGMTLSGPLDALAASSAILEAKGADGSTLTVNGTIDDLSAGEGAAFDFVALTANASRTDTAGVDDVGHGDAPGDHGSPSPSASGSPGGGQERVKGVAVSPIPKPRPIRMPGVKEPGRAAPDDSLSAEADAAFHLLKMAGRIEGGVSEIAVNELVLNTNLARFQLQTIGPVKIGAVRRTVDGRLQIADIQLRQDWADGGALEVAGSLDDALELRGWSLDADFRVPVFRLITGRPEAGDVGGFAGSAALSDASGAMQVTSFDAKSEGSDLIALSVAHRSASEPNAFDVRIDIPDVSALASALETTASPGYGVAFDGAMALGDPGLSITGDARLGQTAAAVDIRSAVEGDAPRISGSVAMSEADLSNVKMGREVARLFAARQTPEVELRKGFVERTRATIKVSAGTVRGVGGEAKRLDALVSVDGRRVRLDPLALEFLGETLSGAIEAETDTKPLSLTVDGQGRGLQLQRLEAFFVGPPKLSGTLDVDASLSGRWDGAEAFAASMSGVVSADLRDGTLPSAVVDLAGENALHWLFTRDADGRAPLTCVKVRFEFADGKGDARRFVLETGQVQMIGGGSIDLRQRTLDMHFNPRPKRRGVIDAIGSVSVTGPIDDPRVDLSEGDIAKKVVADTIGAPLSFLASILEDHDENLSAAHEPCTVTMKDVGEETER